MSTDITAGSYDTFLSSSATTPIGVVALSATQAIQAYSVNSSGDVVMRVLDISGTTVSHAVAAATVITANTTFVNFALVALNSTQALLVYRNTSGGNILAKVLDAAGTFGSTYTIDSNNATGYPLGSRLSDTQALLTWFRGGNLHGMVVDVSGAVISLNTEYTGSATTGSTGQALMTLSSTQALHVYATTTTDVSARVIGIAGTVLTLTNTPAVIFTNGDGNLRADALSATKALAVVRDATSLALSTIVVDVSGATAAAGTVLTGVGVDAFQDDFSITTLPGTGNAMVAWADFNASYKSKAVIVSALGTVMGNVLAYGAASGDSWPRLSAINNYQAIGTNKAASNNYKALILTTDPPATVTMNTANLTLPALQAYGHGGGTGVCVLPMLQFAGTGSPRNNHMDATLPMLTFSGRGGGRAALTLPSLTLTASGTNPIMGRLSVTLPMLTLQASGTVSATGRAALTLPRLVLSARGGGNMAATLPTLTLTATGKVGILGRLNAVLPMLTLRATGTMQNHGSAALVLPMLQVVPRGRASLVLPMLRLVASGHAVVEVIYEAYCVNLKPLDPLLHEVTRYTGFAFDRILRYKDMHLGVAADGLYVLGGDSDRGAKISWAWETGVTDFGSRQHKVVRQAFVHGRLGTTVSANVTVREDEDATQTYAAQIVRGSGAQAHRIKYGRGLKANYWSFGMADSSGSQCDIAALQLDAQEVSRKI